MRSAAEPGPKLVQGKLKLRATIGAALVLGLGYGLAPPETRPQVPQEGPAPILETQVQQREPSRLFRSIQESGRREMTFTFSLHGVARPGSTVVARLDFGDLPAERGEPALGVIVSEQGDLLTHARAVAGHGPPIAVLADGSRTTAEMVAYEPATELVLLRLKGTPPQAPTLARAAPEPGDLAVAAAQWSGRELVAPVFVASRGDADCLLVGAADLPPGTPIFDRAHALLAVTAVHDLGVRAQLVGPALRRLAELRDRGRGLPRTLGLSLQTLSEPLAARLGPTGVLVSDVAEEGPGAAAGLRPGDVLEAVGDAPVASVEDARERIASGPEDLVLQWRRAGRAHRQRAQSVPAIERVWLPPRSFMAGLPATAVLGKLADATALDVRTRLLAIEGTPTEGPAMVRALLSRRKAPWLVYLQSGSTRYFTMLDGPAR